MIDKAMVDRIIESEVDSMMILEIQKEAERTFYDSLRKHPGFQKKIRAVAEQAVSQALKNLDK